MDTDNIWNDLNIKGAKGLSATVTNLTYVFTAFNGRSPATLHAHPSVIDAIKASRSDGAVQLLGDNYEIVTFFGLRLVPDISMTRGTLYVDKD